PRRAGLEAPVPHAVGAAGADFGRRLLPLPDGESAAGHVDSFFRVDGNRAGYLLQLRPLPQPGAEQRRRARRRVGKIGRIQDGYWPERSAAFCAAAAAAEAAARVWAAFSIAALRCSPRARFWFNCLAPATPRFCDSHLGFATETHCFPSSA